MPGLVDRYRVVAVDPRGVGRSDKPETEYDSTGAGGPRDWRSGRARRPRPRVPPPPGPPSPDRTAGSSSPTPSVSPIAAYRARPPRSPPAAHIMQRGTRKVRGNPHVTRGEGRPSRPGCRSRVVGLHPRVAGSRLAADVGRNRWLPTRSIGCTIHLNLYSGWAERPRPGRREPLQTAMCTSRDVAGRTKPPDRCPRCSENELTDERHHHGQ
jgi:hypothetical protein